MPEEINPVSSFLMSYLCDYCGEGGMVATGVDHPSWPAKYEHVCDNCGKLALLPEQYPRIVYEIEG
jgi:hypothetical protein